MEQDYRIKDEKGLIICGFAGIGKSTVVNKIPGWVDLESTPFNKNWKVYVDIIEYMSNVGYNILVSCHQELRDELKNRSLKYTIVCPDLSIKDEYIKRYKSRGNTSDFVNLLEKNWDTFIKSCSNEDENTIFLYSGEYLEDIIKKLI